MTETASQPGGPVGMIIEQAGFHGPVKFHIGPQKEQKSKKWFEPETVLVKAGEFLMGHAPGGDIPDHETPEHPLPLPDFFIGRYPVTNREYAAFIQQTSGRDVPRHWQLRQPPPDQQNHPVTGVSWDDARAYCAWLSKQTGRRYRLPSEAEWEKAARGSDGRTYPWDDQWRDGVCNVAGSHSTAVDAFPQGASEAGCEDLLGNTQEWTLTRWGDNLAAGDYTYPYKFTDEREDFPPEPARSFRIHRGGSWKNRPEQLRCSARAYSERGSRVAWRGFRVVRTPD